MKVYELIQHKDQGFKVDTRRHGLFKHRSSAEARCLKIESNGEVRKYEFVIEEHEVQP